MAEIINLRLVRKARLRDEAHADSARNRARHGRTKAECARDATEAERLARTVDGARREGPDRTLMRTTFASATVRLYHLADEPGLTGATTLLYGPLEEAVRVAANQPEDIQAGLFLATDNDVVAWLDLRESL